MAEVQDSSRRGRRKGVALILFRGTQSYDNHSYDDSINPFMRVESS
jgi:hypothetical protein